MSNVSMRKKNLYEKQQIKSCVTHYGRVIKHFSPQFRVAKFRPRKIFILPRNRIRHKYKGEEAVASLTP